MRRSLSRQCLVAAPLLGLFLPRVCLLGLLAVCSPLCAPSPVPVVLVALVVPVRLCRQAIFENITSQNRKRTESDLSINGPQPPRVDFEASGAPIKITLSNSRTANRVKHSVRNLLHGGLRVGHVLLWFDWMQSMSLPLMHEATIRKKRAKLIRMRAVTGILGRIFLTEQKPKAKMRDC